MAFPPPPYRLPLHREHQDETTHVDWQQLARLADVHVSPKTESYLTAWNRIATSLGMPAKERGDTITAEEWNEAVNRATARHA